VTRQKNLRTLLRIVRILQTKRLTVRHPKLISAALDPHRATWL
jgi:hypothetical protein